MKTIKIDLAETETAREFGRGIEAIEHDSFKYSDLDAHIDYEVSLDEDKYGKLLTLVSGVIITDKGVLDLKPRQKHLMDYKADRTTLTAQWISNDGKRARCSIPAKLVANHAIW